MIVLIIGIAVLVVALLAAAVIPGAGGSIPPAECGQKAITYINNNMVSEGYAVELVSVTERSGVYEIRGLFQSEDVVVYASRDCSLLFTNSYNISATGPAAVRTTPVPVKSVRPSVDLYVMSFCPYGTIAETAMSPVVELLGSKADIRVRYIASVTGTTADSVDSLHGAPEAEEDLQQVCINKHYPEKYWDYIDAFNKACYPAWTDAGALGTCRDNTTAALGIDRATIDACAGGEEGLALLRADEAASNEDGASASPTLFINGVKYSGARTPEAYKQAICAGFETVPEECSTVLSSASSSASGSC